MLPQRCSVLFFLFSLLLILVLLVVVLETTQILRWLPPEQQTNHPSIYSVLPNTYHLLKFRSSGLTSLQTLYVTVNAGIVWMSTRSVAYRLIVVVVIVIIRSLDVLLFDQTLRIGFTLY